MSTFTRHRARTALAVMLGFLFAAPAQATVTFNVSGTSSAGNPVAFQADLSIVGDTLTIGLFNNSPVDSAAADDVLSSFYFDILKGGTSRPTLTYQSAFGLVYQVKNDAADLPYNYTPPSVSGSTAIYQLATGTIPHVDSTLVATGTGDRTWQFRQAPQLSTASVPYLGFGIGTVGNSLFGGNGFDVDIVGPPGPSQIAFSIYRDGNVQPVGNLVDEFLVLNTATFTFSGVAGWTEADILDGPVFGLGTKPDSFIALPEPGALALVGIGGLSALGWRLRRRAGWAGKAIRSTAAAVVGGAIVALLLVAPMQAAPIVDDVPVADWNFASGTGGQGWTSQTFTSLSPNTPVTGSYYDYWLPSSAASPYWHVAPTRGAYPPSWMVNCLTSPVITVPADVDELNFVIRHRFTFPTDISSGKPIIVGELAWRAYDPKNLNAPFQPFAPAVFATGTVPAPFNALSPNPNWLANNYTASTFGVPPLIAGGGGWTGTSPGWVKQDFVMTQVTLDGGLNAGQQFEFRFINAILGVQCNGSEWDVSRVTVVGSLPEPGGMALATLGAGSAVIGLISRRRLTTGPRARA